MRRATLALMPAAAAALTVLPARAAQAVDCSRPRHLSTYVDGATGWADICFDHGRYGGHFDATVSDDRGDSHPVYISFYTDGGLWQKFVNKKGVGHSFTWTDQDFTYKKNEPASDVQYVYIKVCVDRYRDTCKTSGRLYNPDR
jgi:hypothetical protein